MQLERIAKKIFGTQNERELKSIRPIVTRINELEPSILPLTDDQLRGKTAEFRERFSRGENLDSILPEAFAVTREAAKRTIGLRHYDVQLIGGITLHRGRIAEMKTGEGKTLVATLPSYLNGLTGKGVHVVTVNDYLAKRDAEWMGQIHRFLGLSVGIIVHGLNDRERKENYGKDITYGTNNEFGFDYLRDNMKFSLKDYVQRDLHYAIVDEVDSILIDEARTPLIISGPVEDSTELYYKIDHNIREVNLENEKDYTIDEKAKTAALSEEGVEKMEKSLKIDNLYDPIHIETLHHVNQALRAHVLFKRDVDYVVRDGEVMIVDEFTGRLMPGRRWSDGLHQAIEAKEKVKIENENQTLASITFQNYFRMYDKLSGMTGTADTEATEFKKIYKLDVSVIPTNRPMVRKDEADVIYKTHESKYRAILEDIREANQTGQPILVGTISVEKSEFISQLLKKEGITHNVLNAKQHQREAEVVAQAGRKGAVTIATNMAGRGTDIVLGGSPDKLAEAEVGTAPDLSADPAEIKEYQEKFQEAVQKWTEKSKQEKKEVLDAGGLYIIGTERHESRRIDNQLRGRSGRQGDPGKSRFYLSLDDDLMRIFGGVKIQRFMEDDLPIEHRWITRAIENAQKKVEGHNYDIRKHLLEYDDVMNQQRKVVYTWRKEVLKREDLREMVFSMVDELSEAIAQDFFPGGKLPKKDGQAFLDTQEINNAVKVTFQIPSAIQEKDIDPFNDRGLKKLIYKMADDFYTAKENQFGKEVVRQIERVILLSTIDSLWKDHLLAMDHLREGIGLQGYGQKDPLVEYKKQGYRFFEMMMNQITGDVVRKAFAVQLEQHGHYEDLPRRDQEMELNVSADGDLIPQPGMTGPNPQAQNPDVLAANGGGNPNLSQSMNRGNPGLPQPTRVQPVESGVKKVGRNDPCPCGSGKKYKKCHGA